MSGDNRIQISESDVVDAIGAVDEIELLGRGTFGSTFRVLRGEDEYAIKIVHLRDMPGHLWEREIEALGRTDHPNVLSMRESGILPILDLELPFFTCEFIEGGNLRSRVTRGVKPETTSDLRELLTGMLAGLGEVHDLGGLHRDIKPENIALRGAEWGRPVLLDFGLAKFADMSTYTLYPAMVGSVRYMAPEQLRGKPARTRSDLFALGVTFYEVATGEHPFAATSSMTVHALHDRILGQVPSDPRGLSNAFDDPIAGVVLRLLSYRGHDRLSARDALLELGGLYE